jgi:hypothetical protein
MKKIFLPFLLLLSFAASSQFADTNALKTYITDSIKAQNLFTHDNNFQLRKTAFGIINFLSGGGSTSARYTAFKVGGTNAPVIGDSTFTQALYEGKKCFVFRGGELQYEDTANGVQIDTATGKVTFHPIFNTNERIEILAYPYAQWTQDTLPFPVDPDATVYINAVIATGQSITTAKQDSIHVFFRSLKSNGIWTLITGAYISGWSTYAASRIDIKAAHNYSLVANAWTFSTTNGTTPDNSVPAGTGIIPSSLLTQDDCHIGIYYKNASQSNTFDCDIGTSSSGNYLQILTNAGDYYADVNSGQTNSGANALAAAFVVADRSNATHNKLVQNGTIVISHASASTGLPTTDIKLGGAVGYSSTRPFWYATIGKSLVLAGKEATYNTIVQKLKTDLGL